MVIKLTHQFGGSKPLDWVLPCSESNLVHLPTFHNVISESFVNTVVLLPLHVNVPVDFYTLEWKQSCNDLCGVGLQTFLRSPCGSAPGKSRSDENEALWGAVIICPLVSSLLPLQQFSLGKRRQFWTLKCIMNYLFLHCLNQGSMNFSNQVPNSLCSSSCLQWSWILFYHIFPLSLLQVLFLPSDRHGCSGRHCSSPFAIQPPAQLSGVSGVFTSGATEPWILSGFFWGGAWFYVVPVWTRVSLLILVKDL